MSDRLPGAPGPAMDESGRKAGAPRGTKRTPARESLAPARGAAAPGNAGAPARSVSSGSRWRAALALTILWAALFAPQLFRGQTFVLGDARVYRPFAEFSRERWLAQRERTFWNPYVFAGIPAVASLADPRPQYLPDPALDLFERVRPSNLVPLGGPLLAHLLGLLATAWLARALWGVGPLGMVWAGAAWGLLPDLLVPFAFGHDAQLVSDSLLPAILLCIHHLFATNRSAVRDGAALALALGLGLQVLTGHPQIIAYTWAIAAAFALERSVRFRRPGRLGWTGAALALGVALSAAVWLPALLYSAASFRGGAGVSLAEVGGYSLAWRDLLSFGWARAVGGGGDTYWGGLERTDYPRFLGATVLALAAWGWRRKPRAPVDWLLAGAALVSTLLSLGATLGPLYAFVHDHVPLWSKFRVPPQSLIVAALACALLSARALAGDPTPRRPGTGAEQPVGGARASSGQPPRRGRWGWPILGGVLALLGLGLAAGWLAPGYAVWAREARPSLSDALAHQAARAAGADLLLRVALAALALGLLGWRRRGRRAAAGAGVALVAILLVDLGTVSLPVLRRATAPPERLAAGPMPELARIGAAEPWTRVASTRGASTPELRSGANPANREFFSNDWVRWRAHTPGGTHGAVPGVWRALAQAPWTFAFTRAMGVTYMSGRPGDDWDTSFAEVVHRGPDEVVYRLRGALSRAYAVSRVVALGNDVAVVQAMRAPDFDPGRVALTADAAAAGEYPGGPRCALRWIEDQPDRLALVADAPAPAFVVVADTHFPGWEARVDGRGVVLRRVNQLARGVAVPGGTHRIEMRYLPQGWRAGVIATRLGLALWLAGALLWLATARARTLGWRFMNRSG